MTFRIRLKDLLLVIVIMLLYFQNVLLDLSNIFSYLDELISIIAIIYYLFINKKFSKEDIPLLLLMLFVIVSGLLFNIILGIQKSIFAILIDVISNFKFLFIYFGLKTYLLRRGIDSKKIVKLLAIISKIYVMVLFVSCLLNIFMDIGMNDGIRYGIRSFSFIYSVPGYIINEMTYSLLIFNGENLLLNKNNKLWILLTFFIMISTTKTRAFILVIIYFGLYYFFVIKKKKKLGLTIFVVAIISIFIGFSQFEYYFSTTGAPRQMFVVGAIFLIKKYFPLGTGFATYGSSAAADYYSRLYIELGFNNRWGMTQTEGRYLNDNYLPMVFTEFGLICGMVFCLLIFIYSKKVYNDLKVINSPRTKFITLFFLLDIIFSSIQSSYLAHYSVVTLSLIYFTLFYKNKFYKGD